MRAIYEFDYKGNLLSLNYEDGPEPDMDRLARHFAKRFIEERGTTNATCRDATSESGTSTRLSKL